MHWGICEIGLLVVSDSGNDLLLDHCQAITEPILTFSIGLLGTNFSRIWIKTQTFSFKKIHLKTLSAKCQSFCPDFNVLNTTTQVRIIPSQHMPKFSKHYPVINVECSRLILAFHWTNPTLRLLPGILFISQGCRHDSSRYVYNFIIQFGTKVWLHV